MLSGLSWSKRVKRFVTYEIGPTINPGRFTLLYEWYFFGIISVRQTFINNQPGSYTYVVEEVRKVVTIARNIIHRKKNVELRVKFILNAIKPGNPEKNSWYNRISLRWNKLKSLFSTAGGQFDLFLWKNNLFHRESTCPMEWDLIGAETIAKWTYSIRDRFLETSRRLQKFQWC